MGKQVEGMLKKGDRCLSGLDLPSEEAQVRVRVGDSALVRHKGSGLPNVEMLKAKNMDCSAIDRRKCRSKLRLGLLR